MLPLLLALNSGLTVETATPDALCPPLELVKSAVAERLGSIELAAPWTLHYESVHREGSDFVRLELRAPSGAPRLSREFSGYGESCATLAQVMAVVVERYFRSFQADDRENELELRQTHAAAPAPEPPNVHVLELGATLASSASLGPFVRYVFERPSAPRLLGFFSIALELEPIARRETVLGGEARLIAANLGVALGARGAWGRSLGWRAGPTLLTWVEHVQTDGLAMSTSGTRLVPALGFGLAVTAQLADHFGLVLGADAVAVARFATRDFRVDAQRIFVPPAAIFSGNAALRFSF